MRNWEKAFRLLGLLCVCPLLLGGLAIATYAERERASSPTPFLAASDACYQISEDGRLFRWPDTQCLAAAPEPVIEDVQAVMGTMWNLLAVKADHTLWTIPPSGSMSPPEKRMEEVAFASASNFHTLAIKTDGSLWSWGYNDCGQLGDGTRDAEAGTVHEPQKILEHVRFAAASDTRSFAILEDHSLWYWGREWMRDGDVCILTPAKLMEDVRFVAPSYDGILVITDDGTLYGLGRLHWSDESLTFPELTPLLEEVVYCDTSLAVTEDGGLWIWGFLLERYSMKESLARPVRIMDRISFAAIGVNHIFAVTDTGALYQIEFNPPEGELEEYHPVLVDTGIMRYSLDIQIDGLPSALNGDKRVLFAGVIVLAVCGTVFLLAIKKHKHGPGRPTCM